MQTETILDVRIITRIILKAFTKSPWENLGNFRVFCLSVCVCVFYMSKQTLDLKFSFFLLLQGYPSCINIQTLH